MSKYRIDDREFLNGIWRKVRYDEYLRAEEEKVVQNIRAMRKGIVSQALISVFMLAAIAVFYTKSGGLNPFYIIAGGSIMLGVSVLFEHIQSLAALGRRRYDN